MGRPRLLVNSGSKGSSSSSLFFRTKVVVMGMTAPSKISHHAGCPPARALGSGRERERERESHWASPEKPQGDPHPREGRDGLAPHPNCVEGA